MECDWLGVIAGGWCLATVETHRAHVLHKLDVHNTAELVLYAVRRGASS